MSFKFITRTMRNIVLRDHPYFAHLAITHRCNLRCRCCHIPETKFEELDTEGMRRVIDKLDQMGVGVVSISGGGEPLLRSDFARIINYAARKGMYTKLTSNGTVSREKYKELLDSEIKEIGMSLDGVTGNDIPYSHTGPKILESIAYVHDHLPSGKQLTINVTVTARNRGEVEQILAYCAREYPRAKVWLNPVVVGDGALRTASTSATNPDYLRLYKSHNLLSAEFYIQGVEQQCRSSVFDWNCSAGKLFFDVKPNGDFWLCQDMPSRTRLNILDPQFDEKLRAEDLSYTRKCPGCTYSCYFVTQKGFSPENWKDMALLWWRSNTTEGDAARTAAAKHGWLVGLAAFLLSKARPAMAALFAVVFSLNAADRSPDSVLECMEQTNERGRQSMPQFTSERVYTASNSVFAVKATAEVEVKYEPPGEKSFRITRHTGPGTIRKRVIEPLLGAECQNAKPEARVQTDISRRNYDFEFLFIHPETGAYVFRAVPKHENRYLFRGEVWIDGPTCGIRRVIGEPAVNPSFWVKRTVFTHEYDRVGEYWLPRGHRTEVQLRWFGESKLNIDYLKYVWR